jgi:hypothetical protein
VAHAEEEPDRKYGKSADHERAGVTGVGLQDRREGAPEASFPLDG